MTQNKEYNIQNTAKGLNSEFVWHVSYSAWFETRDVLSPFIVALP
jgi:hypothetical protein